MIFDSIFRGFDVMIDLVFQLIRLPAMPQPIQSMFDVLILFLDEGFNFIGALLGPAFVIAVVAYTAILSSSSTVAAVWTFIVRKIPMLNIR